MQILQEVSVNTELSSQTPTGFSLLPLKMKWNPGNLIDSLVSMCSRYSTPLSKLLARLRILALFALMEKEPNETIVRPALARGWPECPPWRAPDPINSMMIRAWSGCRGRPHTLRRGGGERRAG